MGPLFGHGPLVRIDKPGQVSRVKSDFFIGQSDTRQFARPPVARLAARSARRMSAASASVSSVVMPQFSQRKTGHVKAKKAVQRSENAVQRGTFFRGSYGSRVARFAFVFGVLTLPSPAIRARLMPCLTAATETLPAHRADCSPLPLLHSIPFGVNSLRTMVGIRAAGSVLL